MVSKIRNKKYLQPKLSGVIKNAFHHPTDRNDQ